MTIKELVELNFCIAEIEVEVRSNGRLKAKYYIGDGAWRDAKLREHEAHQDYKVECIPRCYIKEHSKENIKNLSICMADDKKTLASD